MSGAAEQFDAVIVGSGFGGAFAAWVLVRAGWRVLMLERGGWARRDAADWDPRAVLIEQRYQGRSPLLVKQYGASQFAAMPCNELVGGQSVLYGGASLRLRPTDFARWPFSYAALEPYYKQAEELLGVHGQAGADPGEPPRTGSYPHPAAALSAPAERLFRAAQRAGLRPFPLPLAINFSDAGRPLCVRCETCDGFPCKLAAKNDAAVALLAPLAAQGLQIRSGTIAASVAVRAGRVCAVNCVDGATGRREVVRGRQDHHAAAHHLAAPCTARRSSCVRSWARARSGT